MIIDIKYPNSLAHLSVYLLSSFFLLLIFSCNRPSPEDQQEQDRIIYKASGYFNEQAVTVTNAFCERSEGDMHDFYSEGDYWWPDTLNPDGPYIRRDGMSNPDNFSNHRHAMVRLSQIIGTYASAYLLTNDNGYVDKSIAHLIAWFVDSTTLMHPHMLYAQAISGRVTGRGIGLIDAIHLAEVARGIKVMSASEAMSDETEKQLKAWFADFLKWITTHQYGLDEMNTKNNHAACWVMTAASFADLIEDDEKMDFCRRRFKEVLLPDQMGEDGSFPREISRTKPYGYSLFNIDAMATVAQILSTPEDNLFEFETPDGRSLKKGMAFIYPFIEDKESWPYTKDVLYWEEWPVRHPSLYFAGKMYNNDDYTQLFYSLKPELSKPEILRNLPIRNPMIWIN